MECEHKRMSFNLMSVIRNSQGRCPAQEFVESLLKFLDLEPVCVECHHVRCFILLIISREILLKPFQHIIGIVIVENALIEIRTNTALIRLYKMRIEWHLRMKA